MTNLGVLALVVSLVPAGALAAQKPSSDPDLRELASYTLTMDTLNKIDRATRALYAAAKTDPRFAQQQKLKAELKTLKQKEEPTDADQAKIEELEEKISALGKQSPLAKGDENETLSQFAARLEKEPLVATALRREGLTAREYCKFLVAMLTSGFAAQMQKTGLLKETPEGTNPANVKFMLEHGDEIERLQKAWDALDDKN